MAHSISEYTFPSVNFLASSLLLSYNIVQYIHHVLNKNFITFLEIIEFILWLELLVGIHHLLHQRHSQSQGQRKAFLGLHLRGSFVDPSDYLLTVSAAGSNLSSEAGMIGGSLNGQWPDLAQ
ncbi:hypothetical protein J5N97_018108 [Dioscorea zingiberensis]|uniref:Uncharacterized protein n=1 Tax=Dioscorea zingiberensis TaxID=325984 RepID=A0A9D5HH21_9LILI|nr:hypothetical protein J5N97_018108 [Dioscorea zingiberensis]